MQRERDGIVPTGKALADLQGAATAARDASPKVRRHFTLFKQVDLLVSASEADADLAFMHRMIGLCSLPRTNPGNRLRYVRKNGPYKLIWCSRSEVEFAQKFLDGHFVMPGNAIQNARQCLRPDRIVHGDHFMMFPVDLCRDSYVGASLSHGLVAQTS